MSAAASTQVGRLCAEDASFLRVVAHQIDSAKGDAELIADAVHGDAPSLESIADRISFAVAREALFDEAMKALGAAYAAMDGHANSGCVPSDTTKNALGRARRVLRKAGRLNQ